MDMKAPALALAAAVLSACGSGDLPEIPIFSTTITAKNAAGDQPGEFAVGEPITITYVTTNHSDRVQEIVACPWGSTELRIYDADGNLVWNVTDGMAFVPIFVPDSFDPGETHTADIVWHQDYNDFQPNFEPGTLTPIVGEQKVPEGAYYAIAEGCASQDGVAVEGFTSRPVDFLIR